MKLIIDKEVDLNEKDLLSTKSYAKSLEKLILDSPKGTPVTIGLFGEWGSGKSSVIKTLNSNLKENQTQKVKFIVYDAWKYANDSFRRMFLLRLQKALGLNPADKMSSFYLNTNTELKVNRTFNLPYLTLIAAALLVILGIYNSFAGPEKGTVTLAILFSALGFLSTVFSKAFNEYKVSSQQPHLFAPEQFEECFNEMIAKALKKPSLLKSVANFVQQKNDGDIDRIVIVIDNIDRCHRDTAYELLTNTKNFIDTGLDVIFLIPVDDNALKKHLFKNGTEDRESEEFLRKYFNITLRIKPYKMTEIFDFAQQVHDEYQFGYQPDTVNIIAKEYASNPRRIIQFYNNLQIELMVMEEKYGQPFCKENEIAICKFLIIREEWNEEYLKLSLSPESFFREAEPKDEKDKSAYRLFLDSTQVSTRFLTFDNLQKILINSDNYDNLPETLLKAISENNFDDFDKRMSESGYNEKKVADYLLFSLKKAVKNGLFTTDVPETLDMLYNLLNHFQTLDASFYGRIESEISRAIDTHIGHTKSPDHLMLFSNHALERGINFMHSSLLKYFRNFEFEEGKFLDTEQYALYGAYIRHANNTQLENAKKAFDRYLRNPKMTDKVDPLLDGHRLESLYDRDIIAQFLTNPEILFWDNEHDYNSWLYLAKTLVNPTELLISVYTDAERSLDQDISQKDECIMVLFPVIQNTSAFPPADELTNLVSKVNDRLFISSRTSGSSRTRYLEDLAIERTEDTINYILQSYRITGGSSSAAGWIAELFRIFQEPVIKPKLAKLIARNDKSLDFASLKENILALTDADELSNQIWLDTIYRQKNGKPIYNSEEIKTVLTLIVDQTSGTPQQYQFIKQHLEFQDAKDIIPKVLIELEEGKFQELTMDIQSLAFDLITDERHISAYKNNFPILNIVASGGNKKQIKKMINLIKSNLLDIEQSNNTLELIRQINQMNPADAKSLLDFIGQNDVANIAAKKEVEETKSVLNKFTKT
jgi:hypothetical protein